MPWNALVDRGRLAAAAGVNTGIAYFEWSADPADDPDDPETWRRCMPALGHTITEPVVAHARQTFKDGEFRRAFLNLKTKADDRVLPAREWDSVCSASVAPDPVVAFALDVNAERSAGAIVAAAPGVAELVEHRDGIGWLVDRAASLAERHGNVVWVIDASGPAGPLIPELEARRLRVHPATPRELIDACGHLYDGVMEHKVALRRDPKLDAAAAGAAKRQVGDAWAWTRKNALADISPLVAATLALWATSQIAPEVVPMVSWR